MSNGLTPGREREILQIDPNEFDSLSAVLAQKKRVALKSEHGVTVSVTVLKNTKIQAVNAVLTFPLEIGVSELSSTVNKLLGLFRTFGCKTVFQLVEDPAKQSLSYTFSRELGESKPREFVIGSVAGKTSASLSLRYKLPVDPVASSEPQILKDLFQVLSKELVAIYSVINPDAYFSKVEIFKANLGLNVATLPIVDLPVLSVPTITLDDLIGQNHVVTRLRSGLERIERKFRTQNIVECPATLQAKLKILQGLMTAPDGFIFVGPSGVGKNFAVEGFVTEIAEILKQYRPTQTLLVETISPTIIRSKWWGGDERNVKELFERLRKGVETSGIAVLFIDEADTLLADASHGGHQSGITNQFKIELNNKEGIIVILNSNNPENIDSSIISRVGRDNELEFNFLTGTDVARLISNEFSRYERIFSPESVTADFTALIEDRQIALRNDLTGREARQHLDAIFSRLAEQEIELSQGIPAREILNFFRVDNDYLKELILKLHSA